MSMEALTSISGNSYPAPEMPRIQSITTPKQSEIKSEITSQGTKEIGEKAFEETLEQLKRLMSHKNIQVENYRDKDTGVQQVVFRDSETGKVIKSMPGDAVVEIVNRAIKKMESWLFDTFA